MASPKPLRRADQNLVGLAGNHDLLESVQEWAYLVGMTITGRHDGTNESLATGIDPWICATAEAARSVYQEAP